jgi:hypothetical protein
MRDDIQITIQKRSEGVETYLLDDEFQFVRQEISRVPSRPHLNHNIDSLLPRDCVVMEREIQCRTSAFIRRFSIVSRQLGVEGCCGDGCGSPRGKVRRWLVFVFFVAMTEVAVNAAFAGGGLDDVDEDAVMTRPPAEFVWSFDSLDGTALSLPY